MENDRRQRSPDYPALSLADALEKLGRLSAGIHNHPAPREVVAKAMGYGGLNGASATAISSLQKYGLLDRGGGELRISERGMSILHPHSREERAAAIRAAAREPKLFADLGERFPGRAPNEELLRNYLVRNGFAQAAAGAAILAYRQTLKLVEDEAGGHDSPLPRPQEVAPMLPLTHAAPSGSPAALAGKVIPDAQGDERLLGNWSFEDGGFVKIVAGGAVDTETALEMAETLIEMRRRDLRRKNERIARPEKEDFAPRAEADEP